MCSHKDEPRSSYRLRSLPLLSGSGTATLLLVVLLPAVLGAQIGPADYERALNLQQKYTGLVLHMPDEAEWIEGTDHFVYRRSTANGHEIYRKVARIDRRRLALTEKINIWFR